MNRLLAAAIPMLIITPALAQEPPAGAGGQRGGWNANQTKAEAEARAEMLFNRMDANHDGVVTQDEVDQLTKAMTAQMGNTGMAERIARTLADADADHDGKITLAEAKASADRRFDAADANHDGVLTPDERRAARAAQGQAPQ